MSIVNLFSKSALLFLIFLITPGLCYRVETEKDALEYLAYYGYINPSEMRDGFGIKDCNKKLKEFQKLSLVDITGKLDEATLKAMNTPRCGCPDFIHLSFKNEVDPSHENRTEVDRPHHDHPYHTGKEHFQHHQHHHHHNSFHDHGRRSNDSYFNNKRHNKSKHSRRSKRYVLSESRWNNKVVSYSISSFPSRHGLRVSERDIEDAIHKAFNIWEEHIDLKFSYQPNAVEPDIELSFVSGLHGDNYPFEGPGGTLAHAFFPGTGLGGDVHFEQEEDWTVGTYGGVNVLYVAVHEIGHSLGLGHSYEYGSIMYPMYKGYIPGLQLHQDDISGVQALYGTKRPTVPVTSTPRPRPTTPRITTTTTRYYHNRTTIKTPAPPTYPNDDLCDDAEVDAVTVMLDNAFLVFKGIHVYEISENGEGVLPGWPKRIDSYFRGLEGDLDCVLTRSNGKTYFFKGSKYWRFTGRQMDRNYPRSIAQHFPSIPDNLDAAFEWDGEFVFTKGDKFWRFNTRSRPQVHSYFPMPIQHWGLTKRLDATFTSANGSVYMFQNDYYWEFDKNTHQIMNSHQGPSLTSENWFGCREP